MSKRPRDPNQLAKMIVDIATGEIGDTASESKRHHSDDFDSESTFSARRTECFKAKRVAVIVEFLIFTPKTARTTSTTFARLHERLFSEPRTF
ncbi:MAG TPA: hypothetical protein VFQ18_03180 [Candidatus Acidoferrum sp.]|nr:hypothetical protein [Candidatus Acidoferrum sp.]